MGGFRSTGGHSGIDFAAPGGTLIRAAVGGTVIFAGQSGAYGNLVKVQHNDGTVGYYAHQSSYAVQPGQRIARGSLIGRVGSTGNSTGPHLHFEVRRDGRPVDPRPWLGDQDLTAPSADPTFSPGDLNLLPAFSSSSTGTRDNAALMEALEEEEAPAPQAGQGTLGGGFPMRALVEEEEKETEQGQQNPFSLSQMLGKQEQFDRRAQEGFAQSFPQRPPARPYGQTVNLPAAPQRGGNAFQRLLNAISGQESGNNYRAVNQSSGALGKYQIMPGNISSWSKAALGYSVTPQQFLRDDGIQEQIAQHRMGQYYQKYGAAGAALAWYAGEGALKYSSTARNRSQGAYPSMNSYVRQVLERAGL
jgi:hypothetical protein